MGGPVPPGGFLPPWEPDALPPWELPKDAPAPAVVPFDANQAKKHQDVWAAYLKQPIEVESKVGMKFVLIPPGEYPTNIPLLTAQAEGGPDVRIRITKPFYIATTEVTVEQFKAFVDDTKYVTEAERKLTKTWPKPDLSWQNPGYAIQPDDPVSQVSDADCQAFCEWLSMKEKVIHRLPTEAEWEWAARAGRKGIWVCGQTKEEQEPHAWLAEATPHTVRTKKANAFGLFDVLGNSWEMCIESGRELMPTNIDPIVGGHIFRGQAFNAYANVNPSYCSIQAYMRMGGSVYQGAGFRVLRQTTNEPLKSLKFGEKTVMVQAGQPLSDTALVPRPEKIAGVRSWSIEMGSHSGEVNSVAWSPKGDLIATGGGSDFSVRLWNRDCQLVKVLMGHRGGVGTVAFSRDGKWLASGS